MYNKEERWYSMTILKWLNENIEKASCFVLLVAMTLIVAIQIVFRFVGAPLAWTEELARYCFVWLIYISCSYAIKVRGHVKVDVMLLLLRRRGEFILYMVSNILFLFFAVTIAIICGKSTFEIAFIRPQISAGAQLPMWVPYLGIPVGSALMVIRLIQDSIRKVREYRSSDDHSGHVKVEGVKE